MTLSSSAHTHVAVPPLTFYPKTGSAFSFCGTSIALCAGKSVAITGPSGCGKSTLMRYITGLLSPHCFAYTSPNATSSTLHPSMVAYMGAKDVLIPWLNVAQNVTLSSTLQSTPINQKRAAHLLRAMDIDHATSLFPCMLSSGMQQRVLLARTLYMKRAYLFLDEPFAHLDDCLRTALLQKLLGYARVHNMALCFITHDPLEAQKADVWYTCARKRDSLEVFSYQGENACA